MARSAKDGTQYTNQMGVNSHNARMDAQAGSSPSPAGGGSSGSITDDPQAMQAIDYLVQKGYTSQDVEQAMDADSGASDQSAQPDASQPAQGAAPVSIPGLS